MQGWEHNSTRVWDLVPDVITELHNMAEVDAESLPIHEPHFDPIAFQEENTDPKLTNYALSKDELQDLGIVATRVRLDIYLKARLYEIRDS